MIRGRARFQISRGELLTLSRDTTRFAANRAARIARDKIQSNIFRAGRVNTGDMWRKLNVEEGKPGRYRTRFRVRAMTPYYMFQERGTKAHGPVKAKAMRFKPKGKNTYVFARWVRGVRPGRFMRDAIAQMRMDDFTLLN